MKRLTLYVIAIIGIGLMFSCEKKEADPVLDMSKTTPAIVQEPAADIDIILLEDEADSLINFSWTEATYNLQDLQTTSYSLQVDVADSNFVHAKELVNTTETNYSVTVSSFNTTLMSLGLSADSVARIEIRVVSRINTESDYSAISSGVKMVNVTPYQAGGAAATPLYLIGDGTTIGWDNTNTDLQFSYDPDAKVYKIVATLGGGGLFIKAFEVPGQWAPQWGTDETGTSEGGPLVYRPDEETPDPAAIPTPEEAGDYLIVFDLENEVYTIELSDIDQTMHIIGDATDAGWTNTDAIPMEKTAPGHFQLVANLNADATEGFKFLVNQGAWAPMYGTVEGAAFESGVLVYRETESDPDPKSIPPPPSTGSYLIEIDIVGLTYTVTPQ